MLNHMDLFIGIVVGSVLTIGSAYLWAMWYEYTDIGSWNT